MKVLITKAFNSSWYYHKVGEIVEVELSDDNFDANRVNKSLGTTYTTQSIAQQIVAELNEKRFVRV